MMKAPDTARSISRIEIVIMVMNTSSILCTMAVITLSRWTALNVENSDALTPTIACWMT